jgi:hypothetical protein
VKKKPFSKDSRLIPFVGIPERAKKIHHTAQSVDHRD